MWLIDLFRPSYRVSLQNKVCLGCQAHKEHIEDLQALLRSEREGIQALQTLLFQRTGLIQPESPASEAAEMKPLRSIQTMAQRRRAAEQREAKDDPEAKKNYWSKVQAEYEKAGKLPTGA